MRNLYFTIIFEYGGGTYISQIEADSPRTALLRWGSQRPSKDNKSASHARRILSRSVDARSELTSLDGLKNVWCASASHRDKLALAHIVLTQT